MSLDESPHESPVNRLPVNTYHCRFCSHLLLATTRRIDSLPQRKRDESGGGLDGAIILPLTRPSSSSSSDHEQNDKIDHVTILLSTILPNSFRSIVRRADGFEKRIFLRCGRCHVFVGYFLDAIHFPAPPTPSAEDKTSTEPKVVYILPGALVDTSLLAQGDEAKLSAKDGEWREWFHFNGNNSQPWR